MTVKASVKVKLEQERLRLQKIVDNFKREEMLLAKDLAEINLFLKTDLSPKERERVVCARDRLEYERQRQIDARSHLPFYKNKIQAISRELKQLDEITWPECPENQEINTHDVVFSAGVSSQQNRLRI